MKLNVAMTIAGSDPSGGAGIQADLKTFHQFGVYGEAVITLLTVQNTRDVMAVECLNPDLVRAQIRAVVDDIPPAAAKTGALGTAAIIECVAQEAASFSCPLVVDPVMISKHGARLVAEATREALVSCLFPIATLVTPNLHEAAVLADIPVDDPTSMRSAALAIHQRCGAAVLVKGGHLEGVALDILYDGSQFHEYRAQRVNTNHTHGTGCTYSAAITACLASGMSLHNAVALAKQFISRAIETNPGLGGGSGPVNHFAPSTMKEL